MSEELKKYAIYLAIIAVALGFIVHNIKSCGPVVNVPGIGGNQVDPSLTPVVDRIGDTTNAKKHGPGLMPPRTPTPKEASTPIPGSGGEKPASIIDVKPVVCRPWMRLKQQIVVGDRGNTYFAQVCSPYIGLNFKTKFLLGYNGYANFGLMQNVFSYDRYDLGAIIAFPAVGIGLSGYLTDNFYLMGGAGWNYIVYDNISEIKTYSIGDFKARPMIGLGFNF